MFFTHTYDLYLDYKPYITLIKNFILNKITSYKFKILQYFVPTNLDVESNLLNLTYIYNNKYYNIYLPYSKRLISKMLNYNVYIKNSDDSLIDITQQLGVGYVIQPKHLHHDQSIVFKDIESGDFICYNNSLSI